MTTGSSSSISDLTPILDSGLRPKGVKRKRLGNTLFGLVLGLLFAGVLIQSSNSARDARNPIADFAVFSISWPLRWLLPCMNSAISPLAGSSGFDSVLLRLVPCL